MSYLSPTLKEREDALFVRWRQACRLMDGIDPDADFASDGLLYRGAYELIGGCWERRPGNETELWNNASCRLLILTKDTTRASEMDDIRIETARKNHTGTVAVAATTPFHRNLTLWSYALLNTMQGGEAHPYDNTPSWDELSTHYATAPIARVNCKKQIGVSTIQDTDLGSHMERYAHFLREQIALYDADIILCCGGHGIIKDFVKQHYLPDLQCFSSDGWVYYSPTTRKVVIDSYHPTFAKSFKSIQLYYELMMSDVRAFITEHPEYLRRTT